MRRVVTALVTAAVLATGLATVSATQASALDGSQFDPGNIISDQYFYDSNAMSQAEIQSFLDAKIGACLNGACLNVGVFPTLSRGEVVSDSTGNVRCGAYSGGGLERASAIIFKVQQACGISAKVLLVTLHKEQGLVTKTAPSQAALDRAMGFACPDTAPCAPTALGFGNQVYMGALQLNTYRASRFSVQPGVNTIRWNPNAACGSSTFNIQNYATAALYAYTPYRPNAAALTNLRGTGDGCSSYGNRNFWVFYNDWFGSPTQPPGTPEGAISSITTSANAVTLEGWAVDPDAVTSTVALSIQLGSTWQVLYADKPGVDRSGQYPGAGANHDFRGTLSIPAGTHSMCVYPVNAGGIGSAGWFGCRTVVVPNAPAPVGAIETAVSDGQSLTFSGWTVRPDAPTTAVPVAVNIGAQWFGFSADQPNATAPVEFAGAGPNQGYSGSIPVTPGLQTFCVWAAPTTGPATSIGCRSVLVEKPKPSVSKIDEVTGTANAIKVSGWSVWPEAKDRAVPVAVNIGAAWHALNADKPNAGAEAAVPGAGPNHGFEGSFPATAGSHNVCLWASELASGPTMIGCRVATVAATGVTTVGDIGDITAGDRAINVSGWAVWTPSPTTSVPIAVNIGAAWHALSADQPNAAAEAAVPGAGPNHGFVGSIPVTPGTHQACVWATQYGGGAALLGCRQVTVSAGIASIGEVLNVTGGVGGVHYDGWAVQPSSPSAPVSIAANIGGQWFADLTDQPNAVAPTRFSGAGANQGFSGLMPAPVGQHNLCVWASGSTGAVSLGCKTVVVAAAPAVAGAITQAVPSAGKVTVSGWAVWPSALTTPVGIAANIGAQWVALQSDVPSTVTADHVLGAGPNQGFSGAVSVPAGSHNVCVWGTHPTAVPVLLGCKSVVVP